MTKTATKTSTAPVYGYVRVSTSDQSVDAQYRAIAEWAKRENTVVSQYFVDFGVSGGAPVDSRPGLVAAIQAVGATRGARLVVAKRDRLARDIVVAAVVERALARTGGAVVSAAGEGNGDDPSSAMMRGIIDVFAQYERAVIRQRTRAALAAKSARGEAIGTAPLGTTNQEGVLVSNEDEKTAIDAILTLRAEGLSIRRIAATLDERGIPARGGRWHATTVARVLKRHEGVAHE